MKIKYWTGFSKRKNSTKQPSTGTEVDVYLKEETSILNPSFECIGVPENVNYIRVDGWGRYYFVRNVQRIGNDRIQIDCEVDTLASYKSNIGSYNGLIEFASSSNIKSIYDVRNKPTGAMTVTPTIMSFGSAYLNATGCFIIGVLNVQNNGVGGAASYYAVSYSNMQTLAVELYDTAIDTQLENQWFHVQDSIVSIIWLPVDYTLLLGSVEHLYIGKKQMLAEGKKITTRVYSTTTGATSIGYASFSGGAGADMTYLENAPFTTGEIYLPFVGLVPLNVEECAFTKNASIEMSFDILTGDVVYKISYGAAWTQTFNGNMATKMPVTGNSYDAVGVAAGSMTVIGGLAAVVAAIATEGGAVPIMAGIGSALGGAAATAKSTQIHTMINGTNSSAIGAHLGLSPFIAIIQQTPTMIDVTSPKAEQGLPYYQVATISSLSGYVKCYNASIAIAGCADERDTIVDFMNNGFYYE